MKKLLLILCFFTFQIYCFGNDIKIDVRTSEKSRNGAGRSVTILPKVSVDCAGSSLSVAFATSEVNYELFVYDTSGTALCQFALIPDGVTHIYLLPVLDPGQYTIVIENDKNCFEGEFDI